MARRDTPEAVLSRHVRGLPDEYLQCKITRRHVPPLKTDPARTHYRKQRNGTYQETWYCIMCGTKVTQIIAASGFLDDRCGKPDYDWPKGYPTPKEARGVGAAEGLAMARREGRLRNEQAKRDAVKLAEKKAIEEAARAEATERQQLEDAGALPGKLRSVPAPGFAESGGNL